jgi:hypothetical protein
MLEVRVVIWLKSHDTFRLQGFSLTLIPLFRLFALFTLGLHFIIRRHAL